MTDIEGAGMWKYVHEQNLQTVRVHLFILCKLALIKHPILSPATRRMHLDGDLPHY